MFNFDLSECSRVKIILIIISTVTLTLTDLSVFIIKVATSLLSFFGDGLLDCGCQISKV